MQPRTSRIQNDVFRPSSMFTPRPDHREFRRGLRARLQPRQGRRAPGRGVRHRRAQHRGARPHRGQGLRRGLNH